MNKIKFVSQEFDYDCGPASATMATRSLGYAVDLKEMTRLCKTSPLYGTSPESLVEGLQRVGLSATIHDKLEYEDLMSLASKDCVIILDYWDQEEGHYVVLVDLINYANGDKGIVVADPAYDNDPSDPESGMVELSWDYFYTNWFDYEVSGKDRRFTDRLAIVVSRVGKQKKVS